MGINNTEIYIFFFLFTLDPLDDWMLENMVDLPELDPDWVDNMLSESKLY